jgi:hypothetical protein
MWREIVEWIKLAEISVQWRVEVPVWRDRECHEQLNNYQLLGADAGIS